MKRCGDCHETRESSKCCDTTQGISGKSGASGGSFAQSGTAESVLARIGSCSGERAGSRWLR